MATVNGDDEGDLSINGRAALLANIYSSSNSLSTRLE
jgi:hypothetical protein